MPKAQPSHRGALVAPDRARFLVWLGAAVLAVGCHVYDDPGIGDPTSDAAPQIEAGDAAAEPSGEDDASSADTPPLVFDAMPDLAFRTGPGTGRATSPPNAVAIPIAGRTPASSTCAASWTLRRRNSRRRRSRETARPSIATEPGASPPRSSTTGTCPSTGESARMTSARTECLRIPSSRRTRRAPPEAPSASVPSAAVAICPTIAPAPTVLATTGHAIRTRAGSRLSLRARRRPKSRATATPSDATAAADRPTSSTTPIFPSIRTTALATFARTAPLPIPSSPSAHPARRRRAAAARAEPSAPAHFWSCARATARQRSRPPRPPRSSSAAIGIREPWSPRLPSPSQPTAASAPSRFRAPRCVRASSRFPPTDGTRACSGTPRRPAPRWVSRPRRRHP